MPRPAGRVIPSNLDDPEMLPEELATVLNTASLTT
jgi:hypothetical protein